MSLFIERCVTLCNEFIFFLLCSKVNDFIVLDVYNAFVYLTVRCFNESEVVDLRVYTKRGDQSDIGSFGCFNRTKTAVVRKVYVTHFKSGALTRKAARAEGRQTALVGYLRQRVCLVHEL